VIGFLKPTAGHISTVAENMRAADAAEVWASNRHSPRDALEGGVSASKHSVCVTYNGQAVAIYGLVVRDVLSGLGVPWMLTTDGVISCRRELMTVTPEILGKMLKMCKILENNVHVENKVSVRWLSKLGFVIGEAEPLGVQGEMFHKFSMVSHDV